MKVQITKHEIPEEISSEGGAFVRLVNKSTVDLETTIDEAKDGLYVVGDKLYILGVFVGLFKSMQAGIERDGNARQLGDFLTLYPVPQGTFDLDKGWDPLVNTVKLRARILGDLEIDDSKWEYEDVTPGRQGFTLESVQGGPVTGVVKGLAATAINGKNLPLTADIRVQYQIGSDATIYEAPSAKVTATATRIDLAADTFNGINTSANDGKKLTIIVRGNYANAKIVATFKYVQPAPKINSVKDADGNAQITYEKGFSYLGSDLPLTFTDNDKLQMEDGDGAIKGTIKLSQLVTDGVLTHDATKLQLSDGVWGPYWPQAQNGWQFALYLSTIFREDTIHV